MSKTTEGRGLATIVRYHVPPVSILTIYLERETAEQLVERLKSALSILPFRTRFSYVSFDHVESYVEIMQNMHVTEVSDQPGVKEVILNAEVTINSDFFLPRDLKTGTFLSIVDQIHCLRVLRADWEEERHQTDAWFEDARKRLGFPEDWQIKQERPQIDLSGRASTY